tara:strand:- start:1088 stop:1207 length:120 start_codon:yes stop_codon:yes gene_type:complete
LPVFARLLATGMACRGSGVQIPLAPLSKVKSKNYFLKAI